MQTLEVRHDEESLTYAENCQLSLLHWDYLNWLSQARFHLKALKKPKKITGVGLFTGWMPDILPTVIPTIDSFLFP